MVLPTLVSSLQNKLPQMAASTIYITRDRPRCLLSLWESLPEQQVGLTQASFKLLPLHWAYETCVSLYEWILFFLKPSVSLISKPCWPSRADVLGFFLPSSDPWMRESNQTPCSLGRTFSIVIVFPFLSCPPRDVGLECTVSFPPTHLIVVPSFLYLLKIVSTSL